MNYDNYEYDKVLTREKIEKPLSDLKEKIQDFRKNTCKSCPHFKSYFSNKIHQCDECKCILNIKWIWSIEGCPLKKW
jgi:hypothetical protein